VATCLSNQKQIGLGFQQYVQDYDEFFPPADYNTPTPSGIVRINWHDFWHAKWFKAPPEYWQRSLSGVCWQSPRRGVRYANCSGWFFAPQD
jgi:hypothetical protein